MEVADIPKVQPVYRAEIEDLTDGFHQLSASGSGSWTTPMSPKPSTVPGRPARSTRSTSSARARGGRPVIEGSRRGEITCS
ncbi:MAG: hypothetical protein R2695_19615 [Acidimicrobiales bacterium]